MPLQSVDLAAPLEPIEWLVPGLIPRAALTILGSLPGVGKTATLAHLAWQLSRPRGIFLDRPVEQCPSLYVDFDNPSDGRGLRPWLERSAVAFEDGQRGLISILEPSENTFGLGDAEFEQLFDLVIIQQAGLVVVDSLMAAFPNVSHNRLEAVMPALWHLRRLARETGAAVVLVDHLPKPLPNVTDTRGILGSQAKQAQARAVHLLARVPKNVAGDAHLLKWEAAKTSFAALPEPFGVAFNLERGLVLEVKPLPEAEPDTRTERAVRLLVDHFQQRPGIVVSRAELARLIVERFNLSKRPTDRAISQALEALGTVEPVNLPGRGSPVGYRYTPDMYKTVSEIKEIPSQTASFLDTSKVSKKDASTPKTGDWEVEL